MNYTLVTYVGIFGFCLEEGGHFEQVSVYLQYSSHYIISIACYTNRDNLMHYVLNFRNTEYIKITGFFRISVFIID